MINFNYVRAASQKTVTDLLMKDATAKIIAGGTNLVDLMKRGVETPEKLIDITKLPLTKIEKIDNALHIGALVLNSTLAADAMVAERFPLLAKALQAGASPQLRNMATVGGNMMQRTRCPYFYDTVLPCNKRKPGSGCSAIGGHNRMHAIFGASQSCIAVHPSDMCVALAALDATVLVSSSKGERKILFKDFHRLPGDTPAQDNNLQKGEMITGISIPVNDQFAKHATYLKVRDRHSYAFALVSVAAALKLDGDKIKAATIAMGGVAHKPWRLYAAEDFLKGKTASTQNFKEAAALAMKDAKAYEHNTFKLTLAPNSIVQALQTITRNS